MKLFLTFSLHYEFTVIKNSKLKGKKTQNSSIIKLVSFQEFFFVQFLAKESKSSFCLAVTELMYQFHLVSHSMYPCPGRCKSHASTRQPIPTQ